MFEKGMQILHSRKLLPYLKKDCRAPKKKGDRQETTQEANVAGDVLQDVLILALDNTSDY